MTGEPQLQLPELNVPTSAIYTGDNLVVLRGINSDCVDLIYLDPPFNSNKQYGNPIRGAFRDEWTMDDAKDEWVDSIEESHASLNLLIRSAGKIHGEAMQGYLTFMAVRLIEMRRVLKPAGSVYLHCDPTASHYLKGVMDSVFGPGNFRNEIVWRRTHSKNALTTRYGSNHDVILAYSKAEWTFNRNRRSVRSGIRRRRQATDWTARRSATTRCRRCTAMGLPCRETADSRRCSEECATRRRKAGTGASPAAGRLAKRQRKDGLGWTPKGVCTWRRAENSRNTFAILTK